MLKLGATVPTKPHLLVSAQVSKNPFSRMKIRPVFERVRVKFPRLRVRLFDSHQSSGGGADAWLPVTWMVTSEIGDHLVRHFLPADRKRCCGRRCPTRVSDLQSGTDATKTASSAMPVRLCFGAPI